MNGWVPAKLCCLRSSCLSIRGDQSGWRPSGAHTQHAQNRTLGPMQVHCELLAYSRRYSWYYLLERGSIETASAPPPEGDREVVRAQRAKELRARLLPRFLRIDGFARSFAERLPAVPIFACSGRCSICKVQILAHSQHPGARFEPWYIIHDRRISHTGQNKAGHLSAPK